MNYALLLQILQLLVLVVGFILTIIQLRKTQDNRAASFTISSEAQNDALTLELTRQNSFVIKRWFGDKIPSNFSDDEIKLVVLYYYQLSFVSRMLFIVDDPKLDIGFSAKARAEMKDAWIKYLTRLRLDPVMQFVVSFATESGDFQLGFIEFFKANMTVTTL